MSDEQLIQAIFKHPFVCEIHLYSTIEYGVEVFRNTCDAYAELVKRDSGFNSLVSYSDEKIRLFTENITAKEEIENEILSALILFQPEFESKLTVASVEKITQLSTMIDYKIMGAPEQYNIPRGAVVPSELYVYTPKGIVSQYGVTKVSSGTCKYNCHSYAWYNQATNLGSAHSAIITDAASSSTLGARSAISKWGQNGVFRHKVSNVPAGYDVIHISAWKRN